MNKTQSENFANLLDLDFGDHVIEAMKEWCFDKPNAIGAELADIIYEDISSPLWAWIDEMQRKRKPGNYSDIDAAKAFAVKADDIVYILRYGTRPLYPEHVTMLNNAWSQFQRELAYGLHVSNIVLNDFINNPPGLDVAVDKELQRRSDEYLQAREARTIKGRGKWQKTGADASRKYTEKDKEVWLVSAQEILKENKNIRSTRQLSREIQEKTGYPFQAEETIRKTKSIIKLMREHGLNKNIG